MWIYLNIQADTHSISDILAFLTYFAFFPSLQFSLIGRFLKINNRPADIERISIRSKFLLFEPYIKKNSDILNHFYHIH